MKSAAVKVPIAGPAEWLVERQQQTEQMLADLSRDCDELDSTFTVCERAFESKFKQIGIAWEDAVRFRSSESDKRQFLESLKDRSRKVREDVQKVEAENAKLEERNNRMSRLLDTVEKFGKK